MTKPVTRPYLKRGKPGRPLDNLAQAIEFYEGTDYGYSPIADEFNVPWRALRDALRERGTLRSQADANRLARSRGEVTRLKTRSPRQIRLKALGYSPKAKTPEQVRVDMLRRRYGLTVEEYDAMFEAQGGGCAICKSKAKPGGNRLHVDHDHTTGRIRALLCAHCNTRVGVLEDSEWRALAELYLSEHAPTIPSA